MTSRIAHCLFFILAGSILLVTGCSRRLDPDTRGEGISFSAGIGVLRAEATKSGTTHETTSFDNGESFSLYGWHAAESKWVFKNQPVTKTGGKWDYSPHQAWLWGNVNTDYYDFLAVYPTSFAPASGAYSSGKASVTIPYAPNPSTGEGQTDLMAAASRRRGNVSDPKADVDLQFEHLLSAVRIEVVCSAESTPLRVNGCHFRNLLVSAGAEISMTSGGLFRLEWKNITRVTSGAELFGSSPDRVLAAGETTGPLDYDLMIPQDHNPLGTVPALTVTVTELNADKSPKEGAQPLTRVIPLKDIRSVSNGQPITAWEQGVKYLYRINVRVGGGVTVTVTPTDWETIDAETPGLMI